MGRNLIRWLIGAAGWGLGWIAAYLLSGISDLGGQALPLVLAAAFTSVWWPAWVAAVMCVISVVLFNWMFVLPQGSFSVSLPQDALLLGTMLTVSLGMTGLMARQRQLAHASDMHARRVQALHSLSEALRTASDIQTIHQVLSTALRQACAPAEGDNVVVRAAWQTPSASELCLQPLGCPGDDEWDGLTLCCRQAVAMGPGTGVYDNQSGWYLPARGSQGSCGAVLLVASAEVLDQTDVRLHAQALCDLAGQAVERLNSDALAREARAAAEIHAFRNTMLAAVSHDYRTPLASILSAATSLSQQGEQLSLDQRQRLSHIIADEATQLSRLTDNALQLARLDGGTRSLQTDWESVEEIVGAVLRRVRSRAGDRRIRARVSPHLPLLRCDAVLIVQLLENLIDNALKYASPGPPIDIVARSWRDCLYLMVNDRGPGIPEREHARLMMPFERSQPGPYRHARGAGLGLALCKAVAQAHGAQFSLHHRRQGGCRAQVCFALESAP